MSGQGCLTSEDSSTLPAGQAAKSEPYAIELQALDSTEARSESSEEEDEKEEEEEEEEEEVVSSARLEPSTLRWSGDKPKELENDQGSLEKPAPQSEDEEMDRGSPDLQHPHTESSPDSKARWRESMPEGDRWRDDVIEVQQHHERDSSLADDKAEEEEEEEKEEEEEGEGKLMWIAEKAPLGFTPHVTIVHQCYKEQPEESRVFFRNNEEEELQMKPNSVAQFYPDWTEEENQHNLCQQLCSKKVKVCLAIVASGILFPLLVWGGHVLLPFDPPVVLSTPLRVVYTLRCSFFATIPILLGMVVLGGARLRYGVVAPLEKTKLVHREVAVHWHYVNESLSLFLLFFLQLAVMATYISQDLVKLVPLLTVVFVFGRLIYWLCLALGSISIRALGFGFSFLPILVMLGANLYYVCSAVGQDAVFQAAPPTTAPPPRPRFWG